jgi:hypothetical protein
VILSRRRNSVSRSKGGEKTYDEAYPEDDMADNKNTRRNKMRLIEEMMHGEEGVPIMEAIAEEGEFLLDGIADID